MPAALCAAHLFRASFIAVATPLLLAGSLFSEVALNLQLSSIASLEYAAAEAAIALGLQEQADKNVAVAALDQTEAIGLEGDAKALEGTAAADEGAAAEQEGQAGAADGEAGEAAGAAGEGAAGSVDTVAGVTRAVQSAAAAAGRGVAAAGDAVASDVSGLGATAAEATATEVAVEGAAVAGEAAAGATAAGTAGTAAALGSAGVAVAVGAPKVVGAAESQWQALGTEVKAGNEESMALEKEAEAEGLESSVPVLEEGSVAAGRAALGSLAAGVGYLTTAQLFSLLGLALQGPVALVVLTQSFCGAAGSASAVCCSLGYAAGPATAGPALRCGSLAASAAFAAALGSVIVGPWARTVVIAAELESASLGKLASLPALVDKALLAFEGGPFSAKREQEARDAEVEERVRLQAQADGVERVQAEAEAGARQLAGPSAEPRSQEGGWLDEAGNVAGQAAGTAVAATESAAQTAAAATGAAVGAVGHEGHALVKDALVRNPNIATTTMPPYTAPKPPTTESHWRAFGPALDRLQRSFLRWAMPVIIDISWISAAFIAVELFQGMGRHLPTFRCGCRSSCAIAGRLLRDVASQWIRGTSTLVGIWLLSILLATELQPYAERVQYIQDTPLAHSLQTVLGAACVAVCGLHALALAGQDCECRLPRCLRTGKDVERGFENASYAKLGTTFEGESDTKGDAWDVGRSAGAGSGAAACACAAAAGASAALLAAMEGPLFSWSVGGSIKGAMACAWLLRIVPWRFVASQLPFPPVLFAVAAAVVAVLVGYLLHVAKRRSAGPAPLAGHASSTMAPA